MKMKISEIDVARKKDFKFEIEELEDIILVEPVKVSGLVVKLEEEYYVEGSYTARVKSTCVRCMDEIDLDEISGEFSGSYLMKKEYKNYLDNLDKTSLMDDKNYVEILEDEIDISELVREQLILDMPQYPSCDPDCKDDTYLKKYAKDDTDLRWAGLMDIKIKN